MPPLTTNKIPSRRRRVKKQADIKLCSKKNRQRLLFGFLLLVGMGGYVFLFLHTATSVEQQQEWTRAEERAARRAKSQASKNEALAAYRLIRKERKEARKKRGNRTNVFYNSTSMDMKPLQGGLPNLIRQQQKQQQQQQQQQQQYAKEKSDVVAKSSLSSLSMSRRPDLLFLRYHLQKDQPYNITYGRFTTCKVGITTNKWGRKPVERVPLHDDFSFLQDFTTTIETNMKILSLGDSVGIQFHQILEEATGAIPENRHIQTYAWGEHESVSVAAPIRGGGVLGAFRMTGMLLERHRGKPPPNAPGGGWLPEHVTQLLEYQYNGDGSGKDSHNRSTIQSFDAMIFRIPHGWITLDEITKETVTESILMAHKLFGIKTAVVMTVYFNNNVQTEAQMDQLVEKNMMIRNLVADWDPSDKNNNNNDGIQLLLMDFGAWAEMLMHKNAALAGMDQNHSNYYPLARLGCVKKFPPSLAMVCTENVPADSCACKRNMISIDGLHWCMESIGGRVMAAIACLLQCPLKKKTEGEDFDIKACERTCNERFMSMETIEIE